jgi:hypothetical protein
MDNGEICFLGVLPLALQAKLCRLALGEEKYPRSLAIEPVHDKNTIPGLGNTLADIIRENEVSCS